MKLAIFITFLLINLSSSFAKEIWIGIAGPGPDLGLLGHSVAIFKDKDQKFSQAKVFSYGVNLYHDNKKIEMDIKAQLLALAGIRGETRFFAESYSLQQFYKVYGTLEKRELTLYKLKISEDDALTIFKDLNSDVSDKNFYLKEKYSLWDNNCLTYLIDHANRYLDDDKKIIIPDRESLIPYAKTIFKQGIFISLISRIPMYFTELIENHPSTEHKRILTKELLLKTK
jgi:hypothetical protein